MTARRAVLALVAVFFVLRYDLWLSDDGRLVFSLPVGLAYHLFYCFAAACVLALLLRRAWPADLDDERGP